MSTHFVGCWERKWREGEFRNCCMKCCQNPFLQPPLDTNLQISFSIPSDTEANSHMIFKKEDFKYSLCNCLFLWRYGYSSSPDYDCANNWFFRWVAKQWTKKKAFDAFKKTYVLFFLCFLSCKSGPLLPLLPYVFMLILYFTLRETYNFWPVLKKSKGN